MPSRRTVPSRPPPRRSQRRLRRRRRASLRFRASARQVRARARLRTFRQGSALAVSLTALLLMLSSVVEESSGQQVEAEAPAIAVDPSVSIEQATGTIRELLLGFYALLPRVVLALAIVGRGLSRAGRNGAAQTRSGTWERTGAVSALLRIAFYLGATAVALSVLAGDASALLGSIGLVGLALSWALQTPIESFTGWLLNSFRGYYRAGDRIEVGDVFGDVYKIDVLTTTVWEAGVPGKPVAGAQPTGAMITFSNWEVLRSNIVNYSRDFPRLGRGDRHGRQRERPAVHRIGDRSGGAACDRSGDGGAGHRLSAPDRARSHRVRRRGAAARLFLGG
jgi:hypothetical protein